ncbi:MAG: geranylgeranyl reductase family protein [Bacillota bacterium]|nr:geranylgeranyl reductase family protein [Bacillota bacterium]
MEKWDVIVIGGGPAGSQAAWQCAARGLRTLVLEKERLPREKPCGGGVSLAAENLLPVPLPAQVAEVRCHLLRTVHQGWRRELSYPQPFLASVRRAPLDAHLLDMAQGAGAEVRDARAAECLEAKPGRVRVRSTRHGQAGISFPLRDEPQDLVATAIVVADGVTGKVSRALRGRWQRQDLALCYTAEADWDGHHDDPYRRNGIEVHYAFVPMGYGWLFPKRDSIYVGLGAHLPAARGLDAAFARFVRLNGLRLSSPIRAALVPVGGPARNLVADGWLLVGDAAGLADPFSGEGIRYAIGSGQAAGRVLADCLERGSLLTRTALAPYARLVRATWGPQLAMGRVMLTVLHRFPAALMEIYFRHDEPFRRTLDMLAGRGAYGSLLRWVLPRLPFLILARSVPTVREPSL